MRFSMASGVSREVTSSFLSAILQYHRHTSLCQSIIRYVCNNNYNCNFSLDTSYLSHSHSYARKKSRHIIKMVRLEQLSVSLAKNGYRARQRQEDNRVTSKVNKRVQDSQKLTKLKNLRRMAHRNGFRTTYVKNGIRTPLSYEQLQKISQGHMNRVLNQARRRATFRAYLLGLFSIFEELCCLESPSQIHMN